MTIGHKLAVRSMNFLLPRPRQAVTADDSEVSAYRPREDGPSTGNAATSPSRGCPGGCREPARAAAAANAIPVSGLVAGDDDRDSCGMHHGGTH